MPLNDLQKLPDYGSHDPANMHWKKQSLGTLSALELHSIAADSGYLDHAIILAKHICNS
jgi:hypothetical protein